MVESNTAKIRTGQKITVNGYFQMTQPWFLVTLKLKSGKGYDYDVQGYPSYDLREDDSTGEQVLTKPKSNWLPTDLESWGIPEKIKWSGIVREVFSLQKVRERFKKKLLKS